MKSKEAQQAYRDGLITKRELEHHSMEEALGTVRELVEQVATEEEKALRYVTRLLAEGEFQQAENIAQRALDRMKWV